MAGSSRNARMNIMGHAFGAVARIDSAFTLTGHSPTGIGNAVNVAERDGQTN